MVKPTDRRTAVPPKTVYPQLSQLEGDAAEIFEIDRSAMSLQLRTLRRGINEGAEEMEMVSAEGVFSKSLSRALTRGAQKLRLVSKDLKRLLRLVEHADLPKAAGRPGPIPRPPIRRKVPRADPGGDRRR